MYQAWLRTRGYFALAAGLFALGVAGGAALAGEPLFSEAMMSLFQRKFGPMVEWIGRGGPLAGVAIIFLNNLLVALVTLVFGFTFFVPALTAGLNGLILGFVAVLAQREYGLTMPRLLAMLLPHGLLELPALFLASGFALRWGVAFWRRAFAKSAEEPGLLIADLKRLGLALLVLFAVASCLEVFVSGS